MNWTFLFDFCFLFYSKHCKCNFELLLFNHFLISNFISYISLSKDILIASSYSIPKTHFFWYQNQLIKYLTIAFNAYYFLHNCMVHTFSLVYLCIFMFQSLFLRKQKPYKLSELQQYIYGSLTSLFVSLCFYFYPLRTKFFFSSFFGT